jgi:hypothetical protein
MKRFLTCALFLAAAAFTARAEKPNFSGEWSLNADKSNLGPMPPPTSMTRKVDHSDPSLSMTQATTGGPQGDQTVTMKFTTDGKEGTTEMMGNAAKTKATWEGDTLVINISFEVGGSEIKLTEKWSLDKDGKTLTDNSHIALPQGEFDITYVMDKK